jgi:hypothetical protein
MALASCDGPMNIDSVVADRLMLTIALDNLIGNVWKFTSNRPDGRIIIG